MKTDESRFTRGAWATLLFVLFLFMWGIGCMLYFFTLPTDGWFAIPQEELDETAIVYKQNVLGIPSALQAEDRAIAVAGISGAEQDFSALEERWQVGATMPYTVLRDGAPLEVAVPLGAWTWLPALNYWILQSGEWLGFVGMLLFFAIAALTFFKRPNDPAARALFLFAALFPTLSALIQTGQTSPTVMVFPPLSLMILFTTFAAYSLLFPPTLIWFAMVFPRPKPMVQRHPILQVLPFLFGLVVIPFFLLEIYIAGYLWTMFSIVCAIALLIHSAFTMRDALSRAQLMWGLWGFVIGMLMFLSNYLITFGVVSGVWTEIVGGLASLSYSVLGITLAIAILRYRLFDIGIIVRRTVAYALVTALLLGIFFGSVILLQLVFAGIFPDLAKSEIVTVLSTLAIAALFVPLRNWIQAAIDRRFNRKKYDAQQVLQKFSETVRDETDLDKLTAELIHVVDETMQPKSVSVWLKKDKRGHP